MSPRNELLFFNIKNYLLYHLLFLFSPLDHFLFGFLSYLYCHPCHICTIFNIFFHRSKLQIITTMPSYLLTNDSNQLMCQKMYQSNIAHWELWPHMGATHFSTFARIEYHFCKGTCTILKGNKKTFNLT